MFATAMQQEEKTVTAQEKWAAADKFTREQMLSLIGWSPSFASTSWKKLPHMVKVNFAAKTWTK
jgi:hypothetical protein